MTTEEKSRLLILQQRMLDQKDAQAAEASRRYDALVDRMDRMLAKLEESRMRDTQRLNSIETLSQELASAKKENKTLLKRLNNALVAIASMKKDKFKDTSQKSKSHSSTRSCPHARRKVFPP